MNIADVKLNQSCCGAHGWAGEYYRGDIGFLIRANTDRTKYTIKAYRNKQTLIGELASASDEDATAFINAEYS